MKGMMRCIIIQCVCAIPISICLSQSDNTNINAQQVGSEQVSPAVVQYQQHQADDVRVQQMAIQTMATMANNLVNIGIDPHNPQVVGSSIVNIVGSFVNFVVTAMRHPELLDMLHNEEFQTLVRSYVAKALDAQESELHDQELNEKRENHEKAC